MTIAERLAALQGVLADPGRPSSDFDLNPEIALPPGRSLRPAAVLVGIDDAGRVLLTKRSSRLQHHPGQVAFPGGKVDPQDHDTDAAALREAWEEVGLSPDLVRVLGHLPTHETVTGFLVTPVVAHITASFPIRAEAGEVAEAFWVPLDHVTHEQNFAIERRRWRGVWRQYYAVPYGPYYIWGATARILRNMARAMQ